MSKTAESEHEAVSIAVPGTPITAPRFSAFSHRNFTIFWLSLVVTNTGTWMASVAEGWLITDLEPERKSFYVGLIALSFAIPMLVLPPFGGVLADRLPKMTGIKLTQVGFLLVNSTVAILALSGRITVEVLVGASFVSAVVLAFDSPIRHAMVPDLVPRDQLTSAVSVNAVAFSGAGLIGPAVGGLLIPLVSPGGVFLINAISSISVLVALRFLRDMPESASVRSDQDRGNPREALRQAISYVRSAPLLAGLFLLALVAGFFGRSYTPMLPVMSRDVYHVGSVANGILISAGGLGAMTGGLALSVYASRIRNKGRIAAALVLSQGLLLTVFAISDSYPVGVAMLAIMGALGASAVALITTLVQEHVPQRYRGRVIGFFLLTFISFPSAGAFAMGVIADVATIQWAFAFFALMVVMLIGAVVMRNPAVLSAE